MVLAASEDKTFRGGFVAAPGRPWAWSNELQHLPVYHAVWSRDLYQIATALIAMGDRPAARRALNYLWTVQQRPDGSFPQNSRLDGEPVFGGLQMDEVAFPIVLNHQLGVRSGDWAHIRRSADFIVARGPRTDQERWENIGGFSPATIAAEIAGLVCAADVARSNGDGARARKYLATADPWQRNLEHYTVTTNGPAVGRPVLPADHRQRRREHRGGDPDLRRWPARRPAAGGRPELPRRGAPRCEVPDRPERAVHAARHRPGAGVHHGQRAVLAPGQLRRVRRAAATAPSGSRCRPARARRSGRGWPLLTGERGEYRLAAGLGAQDYLDTMGRSADDSTHFLAEQVWDNRPPADGGSPAFRPGENTFSATPLAWTHAQFIRLARDIDAGTPLETPRVVACRYVLDCG